MTPPHAVSNAASADQGIIGNGLDRFRKPGTYVALAPDEFKSAAGLVHLYSKLYDRAATAPRWR
ncbi:MAG: hypothetical protein ABSC37_09315 [Xanthobacteraceae bacterium]